MRNQKGQPGKTPGQRLAEVRERVGMTQSDLARKIGVKPSTINRYESGVLGLRVTAAMKIAKALGVSTQELVPGTEEYEDLIENYDKLSRKQKDTFQEILRQLARSADRDD